MKLIPSKFFLCFQTQQKHFYSPEVPQNNECFLACDHLHEGKNQLTLINKSSFGLLLIPHLRNFFNRFSYSCKSITSHRQLLRGVLKKQIILNSFFLGTIQNYHNWFSLYNLWTVDSIWVTELKNFNFFDFFGIIQNRNPLLSC